MSANPSQSSETKLSADRLLKAVRPALATELARMLDEHRGTLEAQANVRLKKTLLDKDVEFRARLEEELRRTVAETTETVTAKVTADLEARFRETREQETAELTQRFTGEAQAAEARWKEERSRLVDETNRWRVLTEYQQKLGEASSQLEILRRFLRTAIRFADSSAVYLNRDDGLALWKSEGEAGVFPDVVSEGTIDPDWYFSSVVVRGKPVAAIGAAGDTDREALAIMGDTLKRSVENFGLRLRYLTATDAAAPSGAPGEPTRTVEAPSPAANNDARQVARAIVSEIKLGHEKEVLEGRVNADLYRRLQREIEEGRGAYNQRLPVLPAQDYFHEEIVKILADNVLSRLGEEYPGPVGKA